ncbi:MAG TPA: 16S rRNA (adenine(1518)-N(6)/adenine(1519)-N(6))-dimethyltransferase RsmA [Candidatus Saccharimonadales bacterium]|nr:16S rRNA (adenine(1518)-N(6)/adenine(1519)-N(6))-dimethyltransferase RsmA [Candidatus Saccharimonadales bacterium]
MSELPHAKKALGQHWLTDMASLSAMAAAADVQPGDTVLEIGPGTGTLTEVLLAKQARVVAIEKDDTLVAQLVDQFAEDDFTVQTGDILSFDYSSLPDDYKAVANIPYYLTSNLIRVLSESNHPPTTAVLLIQKEVAERVAAQPGAMSLLSVTAQFYWDVRLDRDVPAHLFTPPPKVDSKILCLTHRPQPLFPDVDPKAFFRVVKAGFSQKRKTLTNSLSAGLQLSREQVSTVLQAAGIMPTARAQVLSLDAWYALYQALSAAA